MTHPKKNSVVHKSLSKFLKSEKKDRFWYIFKAFLLSQWQNLNSRVSYKHEL